jgi:hypothetical protein
MKTENSNSDDARLGALLRESRGVPPLAPRFQENVWRRIEGSEAATPVRSLTWLDALLALAFRPRLALAAVAVLVLAGAVFGVRDGSRLARYEAEARYVASVAPNVGN